MHFDLQVSEIFRAFAQQRRFVDRRRKRIQVFLHQSRPPAALTIFELRLCRKYIAIGYVD
jgi:hypothetical protein